MTIPVLRRVLQVQEENNKLVFMTGDEIMIL